MPELEACQSAQVRRHIGVPSASSAMAHSGGPSSPVSGVVRAAHSAEDCRRHALFMTTSSKRPSSAERASVVVACA